MGRAKLFNADIEKFIFDNYNTMTNAQIASFIGENITRQQVASFLLHHGIRRSKEEDCVVRMSKFSDYDKKFIIDNYETMTSNQIGDILGFTGKQIRGVEAQLGLKNKKRIINEKYFECIDNPTKAYYLGLIYADGWVVYNSNNRNYEFGIMLQEQDRYIIDNLNELLGNKNIITEISPRDIVMKSTGQIICGGPQVKLRVYNKRIVEDLIRNGIETNKTQKSVYPIVDEKLFFDFLRGYIDGDGCYYVNKNSTYMHITCSHCEVLRYIQSMLQHYDIITHIYKENDNKYRIVCTNVSSMQILVNNLYPSSDEICLKRKFDKIKHYLSLTSQ